MQAGPGRVAVEGFMTYVLDWNATEPDGREVSYAGTIGNRGLGSSIPRWRSVVGVRYDWREMSFYTLGQHIDSMRDAEYREFRVPASNYFDAGVTATFDSGLLAGLSATAGVENLFDEEPPLFPSYPQSNTDPSQYDVLGRRYFLNLRYRF